LEVGLEEIDDLFFIVDDQNSEFPVN